MQHKKGFFKSIARFAEDKGFYIILGLCVVAIGVSGYVLFFTGNEPQDSLKLPDQLENGALVPDENEEAEVLDPVLVPEEEPNLEDEPVDQPVPIEEQPLVQEPKPEISVSRPIEPEVPEYSRPMSGKLQREYSLDQLVYDPTMCDWRTHSGADYECKAGDSVCAIADGSVTAVFFRPDEGKLRHAEPRWQAYKHLLRSGDQHHHAHRHDRQGWRTGRNSGRHDPDGERADLSYPSGGHEGPGDNRSGNFV